MSDIDIALKLMKDSGEEILFSGVTDISVIGQMERELKVILPPSYKYFLKKFGTLCFESVNIYGITKKGVFGDSAPCATFLTKVARDRGDISDKMVKIMSSGYGPNICIDTSEVDENGESPIYEVPLMNISEKVLVSSGFGEFLLNIIQEEIDDL